MNDFSNYFKECILKNHLNVSQLSKQSGINRTLLQKIMTGARMPSDETFFDKIFPYMMLSLRQQETLISFYQIEKMGREQYYQLNLVKSFIEHLQRDPQVESPMLNLKVESQPRKKEYTVYDKFSLIQCISSSLGHVKQAKNPHVYLLMQDIDHSVYDFIASSLYGRKDVTVEHLLCFQSAEVNNTNQLNFNIQLCECITPLLLCGCDYQPMCYYHSNAIDQSYYAPFPYVFLTEDCAINFCKDLSSAIITHDRAIIDQFYEFFHRRKQVSISIIQQYRNPLDIVKPYLTEINKLKRDDPIYTFMHQPSVLPLCPIDTLIHKVKPEYIKDPDIKKLILTYLQRLQSLENMSIYFTKSGLYKFMETGQISEAPAHLYEPFTLKERIAILTEMIKKQACGDYHAQLINNKFTYHEDLTIAIYNESSIIFRYGLEKDGTSFLLNEMSLGTMMLSFFNQLKHSNLVETQATTMQLLQSVLHQYQDKAKG